ncbi:hypothetical protein [Aporhodopirellula aestuarii]|uniref:Uncharacterized protein n=1 Tax=Aporhodopirellula aestuarii TaxID=2950107 RepID=A0ABT0U6C1_9BACT|nr:hypothetical protein [Aporhodopirellula aestuarii]MCM2372085.1 hypothetical protein [Aporhodopirellula aestuarii]
MDEAVKKRKTQPKAAMTRQTPQDKERTSNQVADEPTGLRRKFAATFLRSVPIDSTTSRSQYFVPELQSEIDLSEPVDQVKNRRAGDKCQLELQLELIIKQLPRTKLHASKPLRLEFPVAWREDGQVIAYTVADRRRDEASRRVAVFERADYSDRIKHAVFNIPSEDRKVTAVVPERDLAELSEGDVCEVFLLDPEVGKATQTEEPPREMSAIFLRKKPDTGSISKAETLEEFRSRFRIPPMEPQEDTDTDVSREAIAPTGSEILKDIRAVQEPIIRKLNAWLASLEGKTYSPEQASSVVSEIRYVVASAGCELLFGGRPASLTTSTGTGAKSGSLQVYGLRERPAPRLYTKTRFPALSVQPIQEK